ncbi:MAG: IPT/TIG domain-containing protein, partial [Nitrososphaerales archaeon]
MQSPTETARAKSRRKAVAGVLAAIILFAMIFTVGSGFFLFVGQSAHSADQSNIARANDQLQAGQEKLLVTAGITSATDHGSHPCANCMWVRANNTGGVSSSIIDIYITCVSECDPHESGQLLSSSEASPGSHFLKQNPDLNVTLPITLSIGASTKYLSSCPSSGCTADIAISKAALNYSNGEYVVVSLLTSAGNVFSAQYPPPANPVTTVVTVKSVTTHVTLTQVGGGPQLSLQMKAAPTQTLSCSDGCITLTATVFNFAPWSANNVSVSLNEPYASGTASVNTYSSCSPRSLNIPVGGNRSFSCRFSASTGAVGGFVSFSGHASGTLNTVFVTSADSLSNSIEVGGIASVTTQGAFAANFYLLKYSSCTQSSATQHAFNGTCIRNASPPLSNLPSGSYLAAGSNYYTAFYVQITNAFNTTLPITQYSYLFGDPDISGELFYFLAGGYSSSSAPQGAYYPNYPTSGTPTLTAYPSDCSVVNPKTNVPIDSNCLYVKPGQTVTLTIAACGYSSSSWAWGGQQDASLFDSGSTNCTMAPPDFTVPEGTSLGIVVSFSYKNNTYSQMMPFEGQAYLRSTSTAVNCVPSQVVGGSTKCTATLTDTDGTPSQPFLTTPTGNVAFSETNGNGTFSSASCTLNAGITLIRTESPMAGPVGTALTVTGANFAPLTNVAIEFNGAKVTTIPAMVTTSAAGTFTATFSVPSSPTGPRTVTATDASANTATATFTVTTAMPTSSIALSPMQGAVGATVTATGAGFAPFSAITIKFNGATQTTIPATVTTDASGAFTATFNVPSSPTGPQTVTATDASGNIATAAFTVTPSECSVIYTPAAGMLGHATIQASYAGDSYHTGSSGTTTITLLNPTTTTVSCAPISLSLGSTSQCTATLAGYEGSVNGEQIGWSRIGGTGNVSFSSSSCVLSGWTCQMTVTGLRSGSATIQASYAGDSNFNAASSGNTTLTITSSITLSPTSGPVGTTVTVTGAGLASSSTITIKFNGATVTTIPATVTTSALGAFTATFVVPSSTAGAKTVTATDASSNTASATFVVTPSITLSPTSGLVGATVTVTGAGFASTSNVTISFNGAAQTTNPIAVTTSALGAFTATFVVPSSTAGAQVVTATDASSNTASATFTVTSSITLSPTSGPVGTTVTVTGAGLASSSTITIKFNGAAVTTIPATVTTSALGAFTATFVVPSSTAGAKTVTATDASSNTASATFMVVTPTITLSPTQGAVGATVRVRGFNFAPSSTITIVFNGAAVTTVPATVTTSAAGGFTATFVVPSSTTGAQTVTATDASSNTASATFTVTNPTIVLSPIRGLFGSSVTVTGSGFSVLTTIGTITFNGATPATQTCTSQTTSDTGTFTCTFTVPSIASGPYAVVLSGSDVGAVPADTASASFTVITATITLSPTQGPVGTIVTVTGAGFSVNTKIGSITIAGGTIATQTCTSQTTSFTGAFTCTFTVPTETLGAHIITVSGSDVGTMPSDTATATFTVTAPTITLSPAQGPAGVTVTVTGSGFSVLTTIGTITFNGATPATQTCTTKTTSATGAFTCTFTVPSVAAGTYTVVVSGSDVGTVPADTASTTFTVTTPAISLSLTQGPAGTPVTVTGSGFSVLTTIGTITFNGATPATQTCTTKTTSATGAFTCT